MQTKNIRIYIIDDDQEIIVAGLKNMFRPSRDGIEFTGSAPNLEEFMKVERESFDLILLDLYIPGEEPEENIKQLMERYPDKPVVIYTTEEASVWKRKAFQAGVKGYITKKYDKKRIKQIIAEVAAGGTVFYDLNDETETGVAEIDQLQPDQCITPLEKKIIQNLREGFTIGEIADDFVVSKSTVEKLLLEMRKRFGARNNIQLIELLKTTTIH